MHFMPLNIVANASDRAVGAVLQQEMAGVWQPIAFFSRKLDKTQKHYSVLLHSWKISLF